MTEQRDMNVITRMRSLQAKLVVVVAWRQLDLFVRLRGMLKMQGVDTSELDKSIAQLREQVDGGMAVG